MHNDPTYFPFAFRTCKAQVQRHAIETR